jgi:tetratricopeptide (TPR) repeat protein
MIMGHLALAEVQLEAGQAAAAGETGRKAFALAEAFDARRHSEESRGLVAMCLHRMAVLPGSPEEIRDRARRSNAIYEPRAAERPDGPLTEAHSISLNHYNIGDAWIREKKPAEAAEFEAALRVSEEAIRRGDESRVIRLDLARALVYLGRARLWLGRPGDAVEPIRRAIAAYRELLDQAPADYSCTSLLYLAHEELSFAYGALGRREDVIACHEAARATVKAAVERHRGVVSRMAGIQASIAIADYNLAGVYEADLARYHDRHRAAWAEAYEICDKLELVEPLSDELKAVLAMAAYQKADFRIDDGEAPDLEGYTRAERLWDDLRVRQPWNISHRALLAMVRHDLADALEARGRAEEARSWGRRAVAGARREGTALFQAAVACAGNAGLIGTYPTRLDARRLDERRKRLAHSAVVLVHQAIDEGFCDAASLHATPELAILGADPEYRAVVASLDDRVFPAKTFAPQP